MFSRLNSLGVLLLCSTQLLGQPQIAPKTLAPPENPVTLDQLRRFEDVAAITEVTHGLLQRGFLQQKSQLPPWWPETIWNEMVENASRPECGFAYPAWTVATAALAETRS